MLEELREKLYRAEVALEKRGMCYPATAAISAIDGEAGLIVITPPVGFCAETPRAEEMLVVDLLDGRVAEGKGRPSADTAVHLHLYNLFPELGAIVQLQSENVLAWAQAGRALPVYGAVHASAFGGEVPCTRMPAETEAKDNGEIFLRAVEETLRDKNREEIPAVLVCGWGAFVWGPTPEKAAENARALEVSAGAAWKMLALEPEAKPVPRCFAEKFAARKPRGRRK